MKTFRLVPFLLVLTLLINACKKEDAQPQIPTNLINNSDLEKQPSGSTDWFFGYYYNLTSNPNGYKAEYTSEAAASGTHSLKISTDAIKNDTTFCFYEQNIPVNSIPTGAKLILKAKIKTVGLQGQGVSLAMIGYKQIGSKNTIVFFPSTEKTPITGTNDFREYTVTLDAYPGNTDVIAVHLFYLPKTTGTAYLDDVSLTIN